MKEIYNYVNPDTETIDAFAERMKGENLYETSLNIKRFFDENIAYNRLDSPYFPLQRNDLDTLRLKSGTCGDYSNLVVSILLNLGYRARYAYLTTDLYGQDQDHICVSAFDESLGREVLIDMTYPYRKWHFYDSPHKDFKLYDVLDFEKIMKEEEAFWSKKALEFGDKNYAGLLYAPWIHHEIISEDQDRASSLLYLLMMEDKSNYSLLLYYYKYTKDSVDLPFLLAIGKDSSVSVRVSLDPSLAIYDEGKFSPFYSMEELPKELYNPEIQLALKDFQKKEGIIKDIIP